ncbi:Rieske 2Fe-2S domain-containing protein [Aquimarina hainanensis]|uniref:Rieske 2Fe-2S domain-containing protein n=1 Tax=Aquimarina hainanensis TaxID=1578017 RepID=A0ABW5NB41_9FLAO
MKHIVENDVLRFPHPVLKSTKLRKGKIVEITVSGKVFVLFRDKNQTPRAVPAACPHRGANLIKGKLNKEREIVCGYHAWTINGEGQGYSPSVPKRTCKVHSLKTWEKHGFIWIANKDVPDEAFPDFTNKAFNLIGSFTQKFNAPLKVVLDNFGEIEHAFQVHKFIGASKSKLDTVTFSVKIEEEQTRGFSSCEYRKQPFFFRWSYGLKSGDYYHNDWVFRFKPLHGSYHNYWTDKPNTVVRSNEFIITTFMTPITATKVDLHVFVQMKIKNRILRLFSPIIRFFTLLVTKYEIWEDARIARFAPLNPEDGNNWKLTNLDKQIFHNRKKTDTIYYGKKEYTEAIYEFTE